MNTKKYYFGSSVVNDIGRCHQLKSTLLDTIARRKSTMNGKIISGAFLLLDSDNNIIGFCPLAACLHLKPKKSWTDYDFYSAIANKLNLSISEIQDFILGFDNQIGEEISLWYLLGSELREELQPESHYEILEK